MQNELGQNHCSFKLKGQLSWFRNLKSFLAHPAEEKLKGKLCDRMRDYDVPGSNDLGLSLKRVHFFYGHPLFLRNSI